MAANQYGFDFLKQEHNLPVDSTAADEDVSGTLPPEGGGDDGEDESTKTDLEKQFDVINFLQSHRSSGCLTPAAIFRATGIDLSEGGDDENVAKMLVRNPKVRTEEVINPEYDGTSMDDDTGMLKPRTIMTYGYQAKFNIVNKAGLLAQINRCKNGVASRDLIDAYDGVREDLNSLITGGEIVAVLNPEDKDRTLFPRGEPFLVEIEGNVFLPDFNDFKGGEDDGGEEEKKDNGGNGSKNETSDDVVERAIRRAKAEKRRKALADSCHIVGTETDARKQVRRGEAVWVGGQWFRVSSAVRDGVPLSEQPARAQAPPSVTLRKDLSKKNEVDGYIREFSSDRLPLDAELSAMAVESLTAAANARTTLSALGINLSNKTASSTVRKKRPIGSARFPHGGAAVAGAVAAGGAGSAHAAAEAIKKATSDPSLAFCHARRHGCTTDIKEMYLATGADVPPNEVELFKMLISAKLVKEGEAMRRPRMKKKGNENPGGKPKKRRYYERKNQRITNVHLQGTEIGAALARAAERQQQGKEVGDGGM